MAIENPLHQFTIQRLIPIHVGGIDASYTNAALLMTIAVLLGWGFFVVTPRRAALVPGRGLAGRALFY